MSALAMPKPRRTRPGRYKPLLGPRIPHENHHLWSNHGVWFVVYTIYPTPITKERVRRSLQTHDIGTARNRRDVILEQLAQEGILATYRAPAVA
jgi:hypothetical protein